MFTVVVMAAILTLDVVIVVVKHGFYKVTVKSKLVY
jgi:hypothetical protein